MTNEYQTTLKEIAQIGDPVLRQTARQLQKKEILSSYIQDLIRDMTATMRGAPAVGLAAPQIGIPIQLIVIEDLSEYHAHLTPEQLKERDRSPVPFHVVINPKIYLDDSVAPVEFFEGCLSVNGLCGLVPRATSVRVECLNENAEPIVIEAKGWYARILQHEIDHINGILYIDHASARTLTTRENFEKHWKGKPISEVRVSKSCPCGAEKDYNNCCQPLHRGAFPGDALALMRSRYSAYAYGNSEYIIKTTDPKNINYQENHALWAKEISERCQNTQFLKLDILEFINGSEEAYVTFVAHFIQNNRPGSIHEKSRFRKIGPQWLYLEGIHSDINEKNGKEGN
jgi:peptide deformylase